MAYKYRPELTDAELPAVIILADRPSGFDLWSEYLRNKHHLDPNWAIVTLDSSKEKVPEGFAKIGGGVHGFAKSGKKTWTKRDKSKDATLFATMAELRDYEAQRAIAMGVCPQCWGEGRVAAIVSIHKERNRYTQCSACEGTGKPNW
jgi:hypothetical protein